MVYYRKYRPQTISELDSSAVRESLASVLKQPLDDIPHAFLFTGPKGLGKTSTARIVAKAINCTNKEQRAKSVGQSESVEPCNTCDQCLSITNGSNMDVIEMDAASNRGIDEVRELKETIKLAPLSAKRKVYIIDEVHMLTTEAFNALLKTLEEPPAHAIFILCTTELHKVPVTILSRCFHISFRLATEEELIRSFKRIVAGEKLSIDDTALQMIALLSDSGFRDGAKILEELASFAKGKKITQQMIEERYHTVGIQQVLNQLMTSFVKNEASHGMKAIHDARQQGIDSKYIIEELLKKVHSTLLARSGVEGYTDEKILASLSMQELLLLSDALSKAYNDAKYAVISELPLELVMLDWVGSTPDASDKKSDTVVMAASSDVSIGTLKRQLGNIAKERALKGEEKTVKKDTPQTSGVSILHYSSNGDITQEWLAEFWSSLLDTLKKEHHTTAGVLRGCVIKSFDRKTLVIQTGFRFHKERLDDPKAKAILEAACKELTGNPITVTVELKSSK